MEHSQIYLGKVPVHIEVEVMATSSLAFHVVEETLREKVLQLCPLFKNGDVTMLAHSDDILKQNVRRISICDIPSAFNSVSYWQAEIQVHVYKLCESLPEKEFLDGEEDISACEQLELPSIYLEGLWDSIIVEESIKYQLTGYISSSLAFSNAQINTDIISWNRMLLCYGPPGTGKTTLCKALAQKVLKRTSNTQFNRGLLVEINSHSLFSKWFSESGKLVMKLFDHVTELADDEQCFLCLLIDEIESLTLARSASMKSNEPSDAVRVVNAMLTSLDSLRRRNNVLILCTSNMVNSVDEAFRDRLDVEVFIGPPDLAARYRILSSCLEELCRKNLIVPSVPIDEFVNLKENPTTVSSHLLKIAEKCEGYSGRALRKLPLRAHSFHLLRMNVTMEEYLQAIEKTILNDLSRTKTS